MNVLNMRRITFLLFYYPDTALLRETAEDIAFPQRAEIVTSPF